MKGKFIPPKSFTNNKITYTYIETKVTNSKGERLSENCFWYLVNGKREPMSKGNIENLMKNAN